MPLPIVNQENSRPHSKIKNIIAVAAGKGGVGKSTITANIALALKRMGFRVGIMDTDIYGPSLRKILPEDRMPTQKGDLIYPALSLGIPTISMAYFRREDEASAVRAPIANGIIQQFISNVVWGDLDYLLIDFPPGTGDVQLTLSQKAHLQGAVMITTPQDLAVMDVKKAMHLFEQVCVPVIGVVENMSYLRHHPSGDTIYPFGEGGGEKLARESGVPFLGKVPLDPTLCLCSDRGESIFSNSSGSGDSVKAFENVVQKLVNHIELINEQNEESIGEFEIEWMEMGREC